MTPHLLTLSAFGPFPGTVEVDLDALATSGLFLLHGPTGAGKSTLLDGIGFALFGRVPGARGDAKRLRCDNAGPEVQTQVMLEATLSGRRIRVTRSPDYERPKSRGTGTTTQKAKVLLEECVEGAWVTLSTAHREAGDEIIDLVGMSAEQFFQVVLLPQGEFAKFLRASSTDRVPLLQRLFDTGRFGDVETWLAGRRRAAGEQVAAARAQLSRLLARVGEVAGEVPPEDADLSWALRLLVSARQQQQAATAEVAGLTAERDASRKAAEQAQILHERQQRRRKALERQALLAEHEPQRRALQTECDAARRAAEVAGPLSAVADRRSLRERALATETQARDALVDVPREANASELAAAVSRAQERQGRLEGLRATDAARAEAVCEAARAREEQADALAEVAGLEVTLAVLPVRRDEAQGLLQAAHAAAATAPTLRAEIERLRALRPDVVALTQLVPQIAGLAEQVLGAREGALALEHKALELRVASTNSMIARLASHLVDGVPCDVCGSREHPDPSALRDEGVSSDAEDQARQAADDAQVVVADLQVALAGARARQEALLSRVAGLTLAALDDQVSALSLELDVQVSAVARLSQAESDLHDLDEQRRLATAAHVARTARAEACARRASDADARVAAAVATLLTGLGDDPDLLTAEFRTARLLTTAQQALQATAARVAAQAELDRAVADAASVASRAGFAHVDDSAAALRAEVWREAATAELRLAADEAAGLAAELSDPSLDVPLDPPAPVAETAHVLAVADAAVASAAAVAGQCTQRAHALDRLIPELTGGLAELAPIEEQARQVRALADLTAGQGANELRMTLSSFVLAARLEEVAAAATTRLLRMSQGRYELIHTDGSSRGGVRAGLGLLVRDGWSGQDRDTATLSGGETFQASLSLALGLADVVAAEAGGARLGALFVDEGFGTLDEESLDLVMDVLDGLREGGRVVGLVSHVAELRQRIPAQVRVVKSRTGSTLVIEGC